MRANTKGKHEIRKRFALVIGVAAAGVMALGAQTAPPAQAVVKYETNVTLGLHEHDRFTYWVQSKVSTKKCEPGRRVDLFEVRPGADRKLGTARSKYRHQRARGANAVFAVRKYRGAVYAKVRREVHDQFVCGGDRSELHDDRDSVVRALGAQTALAATYSTKLTITHDQGSHGHVLIHGHVVSGDRKKCEVGRRVTLFKQRPGADRLIGTVQSRRHGLDWSMSVPRPAKGGLHVYATVSPKVGDGFVCGPDRSPIHTIHTFR